MGTAASDGFSDEKRFFKLAQESQLASAVRNAASFCRSHGDAVCVLEVFKLTVGGASVEGVGSFLDAAIALRGAKRSISHRRNNLVDQTRQREREFHTI